MAKGVKTVKPEKEKAEKVQSKPVEETPPAFVQYESSEEVIKAASRVVDTEKKPAGKTDVTVAGTGADTEIVRNKLNGNEQKINGVQARRLVLRKPNLYEIVQK